MLFFRITNIVWRKNDKNLDCDRCRHSYRTTVILAHIGHLIDDDTDPPHASSRRRNIKLLKYTKIAPDKKTFLQYKCVLLSKPGKKRLSLGKKEAKRRFRRAKISGLEELIYTIIFLFLCVSLVLYYPLFIPVINIILFLVFDIFQ